MPSQTLQKKSGGPPVPTDTTNDIGIAFDTNTNAIRLNDGSTGSAVGYFPFGKRPTATLTATRTILASETGSVFFFNHSTEFAMTLPAPAAGLRYTFICSGAPSGANYTIVTAAAAEVIVGTVHSCTGGNADSEVTAGATTITFVGGTSLAGDRVDLVSDGTLWYATAISVADAAITFTG